MPCSPPYPNKEILAELDALAASKAFLRSPGLMALLRFVVEAELRGEGANLKETVLGTAVYHREANYDPKADGIVRVNANRLRSRLQDHYRQFPARTQIVLRPGSYRPLFIVEPPEPASAPAEKIAVPVPGPAAQPPLPAGRRPLLRSAMMSVFLLLVAGSFLWLREHGEERWTQSSLSRLSGVQEFPDFSPDSRRIAYAISDPTDGHSSLYVQELQSNTPVRLTKRERYESRPVWSPDGKRLAFIVKDPDHTVHVLVRPVEEDRETEIYSRGAAGPWLCDVPRLSWSHGGDEIVTTAPPTPEEMAANPSRSGGCGLVAINVVGHAVRRITYSPAGTDGDLEPAVSPDGRTVAFLRSIDYGAQDIYLVGMDGAREHRVGTLRDDIQGIAWMPDGERLLLCARNGTGQLHILRLDIHSGQTSSIRTGAAPVGFAAISRDGRHIAYTEYHQQNKLIRLKDGRLQYVFDDGILRQYPAFSPDGARIAYTSDRTGQDQLWVSDHDGRGEALVTADAGMKMMRPVWSADGKSLIFECRQGGPSAICAIDLSSRRVVTLVRMRRDAILPFLSRDGKRLYFTSNDSGSYAGYRQRLNISASGNLSADGRPEPMTIGGTNFIYESPSGRKLYLTGRFPSLSLLAVPIGDGPVSLLPGQTLKRAYVLCQRSDWGGSSTVADAGLLSVEQGAGGYRLKLYREDGKAPEEIPLSQIDEPIDSIAWDRMDQAVLLSTNSTSIGTLLTLSK
jgi:Tol biopolymer transport system component